VVNPLMLATTSIREFRGNGRTRYMMRDRIINPGQPNDLMPNHDTGTWTSYDGDLPTWDFTLNWIADSPPPPPQTPPDPPTGHYESGGTVRYHLGLAQFTPTATVGEYDAKYFHADHLGTTRAMTDDPDDSAGPPFTPPTASPRLVYTAFGDKVSTIGTADTRYQYVGQHGYETFADLPYQHVGHRWYDPSTGRFLQRDPIGVDGGMNVYSYVDSSPTTSSDASGLDRYYGRTWGHSYFY
jgi:RHS repeat-associated protein